MANRSKAAAGLGAMALALVISGGAGAADMSLRGSLPGYEAPAANWGGFYAGVHGGIGSLNLDAQSMARREAERLLTGLNYLNPTNGGTPAPDFITIDPIRSTPVLFGVFAGYNAQFDDAVIGFEFDYSRVARGGGGTRNWAQPYAVLYDSGQGFTDSFAQSATVSASVSDIFTARMRAGWAYGRFLPYLTAGLALVRGNTSVAYTAGYTRIDTNNADGVDWNQPYTQLVSQTRQANGVVGAGLAMGAGLDAMLTDNIFLRAEYQYIRVPSMGGVPLTLHTVRGAVAVKY